MSKGSEDSVKVLICTCKSTYQDEKYGQGKRVMNPFPHSSTQIGHRCTVCGWESLGRAGGGPATTRRRERIARLGMIWSEFIRKAGSSGKTYDSRKGK